VYGCRYSGFITDGGENCKSALDSFYFLHVKCL
jgi:hypothetical protein